MQISEANAAVIADEVIDEVEQVVKGKSECVRKAFGAILAGGHILIEDVPGVGKTTLALAFSKAMKLDNHRVQFTPDVMPADILGFSAYHKESGTFSYHPGTIMCNLFLADEINRTSPKTQSALLEVMEEGMVTVDGVSHPVPTPFIVIATQNPKGSAGTQMLPESQLDRFMICMSMGYPDPQSEIEIAKGKNLGNDYSLIKQVINAQELEELKTIVDGIFIHDNIYKYMVKLVDATRTNNYIELGISPRGMIALARMSKATAFLEKRKYVIPEDVEHIFQDVSKHRILLNTKARIAHVTEEAILDNILKSVTKPISYKKKAEYHD